MKILSINPGSTSTKVALYEDEKQVFVYTVEHERDELRKFEKVYDQLSMRTELVKSMLEENNIDISALDAIVARGGLLPPVKSGAYAVSPEMLDQLEHRPNNHHASNLGAGIAYNLAKGYDHIKTLIYDPVTVDEMLPVSRITGFADVNRVARAHNLNMRSCALKLAKEQNKDYKDMTYVVAHMGGGITLTLHDHGRISDMISDDDGPFSPERAGMIPGFYLVDKIFNEGHTKKSIMEALQRKGGFLSHFNTSDIRTVVENAKGGDEKAQLVIEAMCLAISKCIAQLAVSAYGKVDNIILTGGIAYSEYITDIIKKRISFIAPVVIYPGENEMDSLAQGALRVLKGEEIMREFVPVF
ncbi:MAG: butyrate kinase [Clostridiales bacterium]|nr:butyrate kinase [Clostridiales bacterium]